MICFATLLLPRARPRRAPGTVLVAFLLLLGATLADAATGTVTGRAVDTGTGRGVPGVAITLPEVNRTTATDLDGEFRLEDVPAGSLTLLASRPGFQPLQLSAVAVVASSVARIDLPLAPALDPVIKLEAFSVSAEVVRNSGVGLLGARQKAPAISDAIGSDQMSRLGFGTAASALKAVTGASVVGGKYVYIRGLGDRYSSTLVNGVEVPSADPDRRAVNLDMFPSDLIDAIVTTKTFTPDRPGNFTGGAVNLKTRDFPDQFMYSVSGSLGWNSQVTGRDFLTSGGPANTWGRDDGGRALPAAVGSERLPGRFATPEVDRTLGELTRSFNPAMAPGVKAAPVSRSFGAAFGGSTTLFGRRLGYAASVSYDRTFSGYRDGEIGRYERQGVTSPALAPLVRLRDERSEDEALVGSLANLAYQFSPDHQASINAMVNQSGVDLARRQTGMNVAGGGLSELDQFTTRTLRYTERSLRSLQLAGRHRFPALRDLLVQWSATDATTSQDEPDTRHFSSFESPEGGHFFEVSGVPRPSRYFRTLEESRRDYQLDFTLPLPWRDGRTQLQFGAARATTTRDFNERLFEYGSTGLRFDGNDQSFLRDEQIGQIDPVTGRFRPGQLYLVETTSTGNSYAGTQRVDAYYGMVDLPLTSTLRLIAGARRETTDVEVRSKDPRRRSGLLDNDDLLPSINLIQAITDRMNLRAAFTKTIARPNFREIADYTSFEFVGDFVYIGNPDLRRTSIRNFDLRWEWFPRRGELVAVSVFRKEMRDPIERGVFSIINSGELQYQNAPRGVVQGVEIEARKRLDFLSERLRSVSAGFNFTHVTSEVDIAAPELAFIRFYESDASGTRELTGQSPYLVNCDLTWQLPRRGATLSAYYHLFGERLAQVSPPGTPNVFEQPAPTLDVIWSQKVGERWKATLALKNLLNRPAREISTYRGVDYTRSSSRRGITTSLGATYTF